MVAGDAETKEMDAAVSGITVRVIVFEEPAMEAVMVSSPDAVTAVYVVEAVPLTVETGELMDALLCPDIVEVKTTSTD
jgi:hypothetical protein